MVDVLLLNVVCMTEIVLDQGECCVLDLCFV